MTTKFIRIEHPYDGCGPFGSRWKGKSRYPHLPPCPFNYHPNEIGMLSQSHWDMPTPCRDDSISCYFERGVHYCGYLSEETMWEWVGKMEMKMLLEVGFEVYKIEATDVGTGLFQVIFQKENIVSKKNITKSIKRKIKNNETIRKRRPEISMHILESC